VSSDTTIAVTGCLHLPGLHTWRGPRQGPGPNLAADLADSPGDKGWLTPGNSGMALLGLAERSTQANWAQEAKGSTLVTVASSAYFHPFADKWPTDTPRWKVRRPESRPREQGSWLRNRLGSNHS